MKREKYIFKEKTMDYFGEPMTDSAIVGRAYTKHCLSFPSENIASGRITTKFFTPEDFHLYHGTNTNVLDRILEEGAIRTAAHLIAAGKLIYGEAKGEGYTTSDEGHKLLPIEGLRALGLEVDKKDERIYDGHTHKVWFSRHYQISRVYSPEDPNEQVLLVVNKNRANFRGRSFRDNEEEGISHNGDFRIEDGLQMILVPDHRVEEYKGKTIGRCITVYGISDLERREEAVTAPELSPTQIVA
jgi:hypothetical protein